MPDLDSGSLLRILEWKRDGAQVRVKFLIGQAGHDDLTVYISHIRNGLRARIAIDEPFRISSRRRVWFRFRRLREAEGSIFDLSRENSVIFPEPSRRRITGIAFGPRPRDTAMYAWRDNGFTLMSLIRI
jgi:hypothetical protein